MIHLYRYSPFVAAVTTLGISSVSFFLLFRDSNLESCNKLYLDFRYSDDDVGFSYQLMHCLTSFMSSILLLYFVSCAARHSTGFRLVRYLLSFLWRPFRASQACVQRTFGGNAGRCGAGRHIWY